MVCFQTANKEIYLLKVLIVRCLDYTSFLARKEGSFPKSTIVLLESAGLTHIIILLREYALILRV